MTHTPATSGALVDALEIVRDALPVFPGEQVAEALAVLAALARQADGSDADVRAWAARNGLDGWSLIDARGAFDDARTAHLDADWNGAKDVKCPHCVNGTVPMTFNKPCSFCTPFVNTPATPTPPTSDTAASVQQGEGS